MSTASLWLLFAFEFVERQPGEWVITAIKPLPASQGAGAPAAAANPHAGH